MHGTINDGLTLAILHRNDEIVTAGGISERMNGNLCGCAACPDIADAIREVWQEKA